GAIFSLVRRVWEVRELIFAYTGATLARFEIAGQGDMIALSACRKCRGSTISQGWQFMESTEEEVKAAKRSPLGIRVDGLLEVAGVLGCMATLFGSLGRYWWFFDLFSHFRVQYVFGLVVLG